MTVQVDWPSFLSLPVTHMANKGPKPTLELPPNIGRRMQLKHTLMTLVSWNQPPLLQHIHSAIPLTLMTSLSRNQSSLFWVLSAGATRKREIREATTARASTMATCCPTQFLQGPTVCQLNGADPNTWGCPSRLHQMGLPPLMGCKSLGDNTRWYWVETVAFG